MQLISFLGRESGASVRDAASLAAISGAANVLLLAIISDAATAVTDGDTLGVGLVTYLVALAVYLYAQWLAFAQGTRLVEQAVNRVRLRITDKLCRVNLAWVERKGHDHLYGRLTQSDTLLSQAVPQLVGAIQAALVLLASLAWLAYLSLISCVLALIGIGVGMALFLARKRRIHALLAQARANEQRYASLLSQTIGGFKEVKLNAERGAALRAGIAEVSGASCAQKIAAGDEEARVWGIGRVLVFVLLPLLVFVVPLFSSRMEAEVFEVTAILLFIAGPLAILANTMPLLERVDDAIGDLLAVEREMELADETPDAVAASPLQRFERITLDAVRFAYPGVDGGFEVGPLDLEIQAGEILFVVGGNGSGKSTLLKLLTGLYQPGAGIIRVDGKPIDEATQPAYRGLSASVFADFHLFKRFYGLADVRPAEVSDLIELMELEDKVQYADGGFTTTRLSTGQRKRLALIVALLEDRPLLVLDEFAADQDPPARQRFYEELLPLLPRRGKTIVAATHDDRYFHLADRVLRMDGGRLIG
jgi:putative ATP-binding cassette transporter